MFAMRYLRWLPVPFFTAATALASGANESFPALPELGSFQGKKRVLVLDTPSAALDPIYRVQAAALLPAWEGLLERDLHVITREGASAFGVRLVGKDGGVKFGATAPVSAADLFALIDAMPMRRAEKGR